MYFNNQYKNEQNLNETTHTLSVGNDGVSASVKTSDINFEQAILFYKQESIRSSQMAAECKNILSQNRLELSKLKNEISICEGQNAELLIEKTKLLRENEELKKVIDSLKLQLEELKCIPHADEEIMESNILKKQLQELQIKYQKLEKEYVNLQKAGAKTEGNKSLIEENKQLKTKLDLLSNVVVFPENVIRESFSIMAMQFLNALCSSFKQIHVKIDYLSLKIEKFRASYNHTNSYLDISTRRANEFLKIKGQYKQLIRNSIKIIDCYRSVYDKANSDIQTQDLLTDAQRLNDFCSTIK